MIPTSLNIFMALLGKGDWKPELICANIILQHQDSKIIAVVAQPPPPAPPKAVIMTASGAARDGKVAAQATLCLGK